MADNVHQTQENITCISSNDKGDADERPPVSIWNKYSELSDKETIDTPPTQKEPKGRQYL